MPTVSIVVPTYERRESLARLLAAIAVQTHPAQDLELIIVDDGSRDGTREWLGSQTLPFPSRVIAQEHGGAGAARNRGVAAATGALIVFFDDDVVPEPTAVAAHVAAHVARHDAVVIGPMLAPSQWRRPAWIRWEEDRLLDQYRALEAGAYACTPRQFFTANASLSRAAFLAAGGFDAAFRRAEDVELGYRLRARGATFVYEPRARVVHYPTRTFASWRGTPYQYGRGDVAMDREKGHEALGLAFLEFRSRHPLSRALARWCVGRRLAFVAVTLALRGLVRAGDAVGERHVTGRALSALFHLLYWQGVADALGGRERVWRSLAATRAA
ncbi:MAG TPA: glycosyltransferase [Candidatus Acidoferrales bacterium]|nr:glycosyltransferase [Candidatus Acidoferrales bacterium]